MAGYPAVWIHDVVLSDGSAARLRPIRPDDGDSLRQFHSGLSKETVYFRFFRPHARLSDAEVTRFVTVDYDSRMAFVAEVGSRVVGVGRYDRLARATDAEVAFVVADDYQGRGIGSLLLEALAAYARDCGITDFVAETLADNRPMRAVFSTAGFAETCHYDSGVVEVRLSLERTPELVAAADRRDWAAGVATVRRLMEPTSVVLVGADDPLSGYLLENLRQTGFAGNRYAVGMPGGHDNVVVVDSVASIPPPIDIALISGPASDVEARVEECGAVGVGHVVVVSSGFADQGFENVDSQRRVCDAAHRYGMRLLGPNSLGLIVPRLGLNASASPVAPAAGNLAVASQSGGLGISLLAEAEARGLGVSSFVSMGNKADLSSNDFLRYWLADPSSSVIALYIESLGNPQRFMRIAAEVSRQKPILTVAPPGTRSNARWSFAHSGAVPPSAGAFDALTRKSGVVAVNTPAELLDLASLVAKQPLPRGDRVAVVGNAGGPLVVAANACESAGLVVPTLSAELVERMGLGAGRPTGLYRNPVNLTPSAAGSDLRAAIMELDTSAEVDSILVVWTPVMGGDMDDVINQTSSAGSNLPVAFAAPGARLPTSTATACTVPLFAHAEAAAQALGRAVDHRRWRERDPGLVPVLADLDTTRARTHLHHLATAAGIPAEFDTGAAALLDSLGINTTWTGEGSPIGVDLRMAVIREPGFGALVTLGAGGEPWRSGAHTSVGIAPLTNVDATEMIDCLPVTRPIGHAHPLADLLHRIAQLAVAAPELQSLILDPVVVRANGISVTIAEITTAANPKASLADLRRLRQ